MRSLKSTNKQQIISVEAVHYGIVLDLRLPNKRYSIAHLGNFDDLST